MQIAYVEILNFRGIAKGHIELNGHSVIIGDNNAGKSTILEAIDLVLGPDRLNRVPVVDEHDFYSGKYYFADSESPKIEIELLIFDLDPDQIIRFKNNLEFWNIEERKLLKEASIDEVDKPHIKEALRIKFIGCYDPDEDDFTGNTYFCSPEKDQLTLFGKKDKRECGFLYLRALRTGARALSMERGSLLDIILRIKEIRPKMWETVLSQLRNTDVATEPDLGVSNILGEVQNALKEFVPTDWGSQPQLRVSDLTREHLRKTLTVFMSTGSENYHAPFHHQGTGTVNTMVLALLSMIADEKKNVIFAMEEPEIAIPPYTQKRIIDSIKKKSSQAIFTSHSPFVLEEFNPDNIILVQRDSHGFLKSNTVSFPKIIKPKSYSSEFRLRFAEALLAKRILLTEGSTEASSYSTTARCLNEFNQANYSSLEALGVAVFDAGSQTAIPIYGEYFKNLGKTVFAVFDKQTPEALKAISDQVHYPFESIYKGFEDLILSEMDDQAIVDYYEDLVVNGQWPSHLNSYKPSSTSDVAAVKIAIGHYLSWGKGAKVSAELLSSCKTESQMPTSIKETLKSIKFHLEKSEGNQETENV
jgi:putative ATP-dependent endonuclease of OLD family